MSLARAIAHNVVIHTLGRVISIIIALVVVAIMARALGPDGFGGYSTIIAFLQFFGVTVDFGLTLTANRMLGAIQGSLLPNKMHDGGVVRKDWERLQPRLSGAKEDPCVASESTLPSCIAPSTLMSNLMTLRFVSAIVFLVLGPMVALFFPYPTIVKQGMFLVSLSFLAVIMGQTLVPVFQKELKMGYVAASEIVGRIFLLIGVALAAYFHLNLLWFMGAIVFGSVVQYLFIRFSVVQFIHLQWSFDRATWRRIFITSWPIGVSIIFNLVYLKADTIILSVLRPQSEVGFYGASYRVIDQFTALATMFIGLVLPPLTAAYVARDQARFKKIYQGAFDAYAAIASPLMVGALAIGTPLVVLIFGIEFTVSGTILGIHMIAMVFVFFSTLFGHVVVVINKQKSMIWGYASVAVVALIAYFLVIPRYGMFGAAWATVGTEVLITVLTFLMVWRTTKLTPQFSVFWKSIFAALIMGVFLYALRRFNPIFLIVSGMLVYGLTLYMLGGIKKETLREIISFKNP